MPVERPLHVSVSGAVNDDDGAVAPLDYYAPVSAGVMSDDHVAGMYLADPAIEAPVNLGSVTGLEHFGLAIRALYKGGARRTGRGRRHPGVGITCSRPAGTASRISCVLEGLS